MNKTHLPFILQVLLAALLFGVSAPLAKLLLGEVEPVPLAALLYLGSGLGLLVIKLLQRLGRKGIQHEAGLRRQDLFWLAGAMLAGGVGAPIVLLFSLQRTPAATASLLLCFEGVATTLIAFLAFREAISRRAWWAIGLITLASILLSFNPQAKWGFSAGSLGILAACVLWGMDNNFTRNISSRDPLTIVIVKSLGAGGFSLCLALLLGSTFPTWGSILWALALGSLSYGASIVLFIRAMRGLGAARTSALFGTAPLAGVLLSILVFKEFPAWLALLALPLMLAGALLLVNDRHEHAHTHASLEHDHSHSHDDGHHQHTHEGGLALAQRHSHAHAHESITHSHQHMPDTHHRHDHPPEQQ
jgi:drug/metabolite transporter (DMT)-like permease